MLSNFGVAPVKYAVSASGGPRGRRKNGRDGESGVLKHVTTQPGTGVDLLGGGSGGRGLWAGAAAVRQVTPSS